MTRFADTSYYLALLNSDDDAHRLALRHAQEDRFDLLTTDWVVVELADALARPPARQFFKVMLESLRADPRTRILSADPSIQLAGIELYLDRPDKAWSLTDCISFVVMKQHAINEALTADHHFEQAGFVALLK